jgi:protease-4
MPASHGSVAAMTRRAAAWLLTLAAFAALVAAAAVSNEDSGRSGTDKLESPSRTFDGTVVREGGKHAARVAMVPVAGTIVNGRASASSGNVGGDDLIDLLEEIRTSHDYDAVILEMNTPGGAVLASDEVSAEVRRLRRADIPVVSWMRDVAASGGYYISASADRIVAHPATFTGSIGVILEYVEVQGLAEKYGVTPVVVKSGKLKDIGSPYKHVTAEERAVLQAVIDEAYGQFVHVVARGRHMSEADVRTIADGRIYTGTQAKANGLVDELGGRATAYAVAARLARRNDHSLHGVRVVRFEQQTSFLEALGAAGSHRFSLGAVGDLVAGELRNAGGTGSVDAAAGVAADGRTLGNGLPTVEYRAVIG